jgi:hypothetical protein
MIGRQTVAGFVTARKADEKGIISHYVLCIQRADVPALSDPSLHNNFGLMTSFLRSIRRATRLSDVRESRIY